MSSMPHKKPFEKLAWNNNEKGILARNEGKTKTLLNARIEITIKGLWNI